MKRPVLLALIAAIIVVPAVAGVLIHALTSGSSASPVASGPSPGAYRASEPPAGIRLPAFALRDYRGDVVRTSALRGKVVLVTFLDTDCKTKCPVFASDIGAALRLLSGSERREVIALALTVNPARDTPVSARAFLRRRHALGIDFLLGTAKQMRPIWKAFHVVSAAETGNADVHSSDARVYDRSGVWVSTLHLPVDLTPANLAHDMRTALAQAVSAQARHGRGAEAAFRPAQPAALEQVQPAPGVARLDRRARSPARLLLLSDELPALRATDARAPRVRAGLGDSERSLRRARQPRAPLDLVRREDHAAAVRRKPDRTHLEPRRRLRRHLT